MEKLNKAYREFLNKGKTERECVTEIVKQAEAAGYEALGGEDRQRRQDPGWR